MTKHTVFVANDTVGSRKDTATLLVGTAREYNINQRSIRSTTSGYWITDELADLVFAEEPEPEPTPAKAPTKTSGDRAAKKPTEKE